MSLERESLNRLYQYVYALCGEEEGAYELLHGTLEQCMAKLPALDDPMPYLMRAARTRFVESTRRDPRAREVSWEDGGAMDLSCSGLEKIQIDRAALSSLWQTLHAEEREILYLWAVEGFTAVDIARVAGVSRSTVLSRLHRLRHHLQDSYAESVKTSTGGSDA